MKTTRLFFTSDIHGSDKCFRKFLNTAKFYDANVLVLGGDLTGKAIVPIIKQKNGSWETNLFGTKKRAVTERELKQLVSTIESSGFYSYFTDNFEIEDLKANVSKLEDLFENLVLQKLESWMKLATAKLHNTDVKCFISPGNDDVFLCDKILDKYQNERVISSEGQCVFIDNEHEMITLGWSNKTPWNSQRETSEKNLEKKINSLIFRVKNIRKCVFNIHVPPINSGLDLATKIDENFKPVTSGGQIEKINAGSMAVRDLICKHEPMVGLHGHIHESPGFCKLGRTMCFNSGSEYSEGILRGVLIEIANGKICNYQLTSG